MPQNSPSELWNELHIQQGNSGDASQLAFKELQKIDTAHFTDPSQANDHGEYARISEVTGVAAAKKSESWQEAREHLLRSLEVVLNHYPLDVQSELAELKGNYWEKVYGDESAQLICLRDVLHLVELLSKIYTVPELSLFSAGLKTLLIDLSDEMKGERFALIFKIEEATYEEARAAYERFMNLFGTTSEVFDGNQGVTVSSRFLGRAVAQRDPVQVLKCLKALSRVLRSEPTLIKFTSKELAKSIKKLRDEQRFDEKYKNWSGEANQDTEILERIQSLVRNAFVGMGNNKIQKVLLQ